MSRIKIIHIVYIFELGGIESFILQLCNSMDANRYEHYIITLTNESLGQAHLFKPHVHVINFNIKKGEIKKPSGFYRTLKQLSATIQKIKPHIIHFHHEHYVTFFILLASKLSKHKCINIRTVHSGGDFYADQNKFSNKVKLYIEKIAFRLFSVNLIAVSKAIYQNNLRYFNGLVDDNLLINNGVNSEKFNKNYYKKVSRKKFNLKRTDIIYTYVSRLNEGKNHEFLIKIWPNILKSVPNATLVFAGDGFLKSQLKESVAKCGLERNIIFLGAIDNVPELLSITDIGVFPSQYEGMSIALLEKFAMSLPVVASDIIAFKDVAKHNYDSFLISLDNTEKFSNQLIQLALNKDLRDKIGCNARNTATKYSLDNTIKKYSQYYDKKVNNENINNNSPLQC